MKSVLSRPGTSHGQRPPSSLSQRPGSRLSSYRPLSRISNRPMSAASRQVAKVAQLTQTLVTQLLAPPPDGIPERYSYAIDTALRCLNTGGGPSQTIKDTDRRVKGWVIQIVIQSRNERGFQVSKKSKNQYPGSLGGSARTNLCDPQKRCFKPDRLRLGT